jgi:MFS family permease
MPSPRDALTARPHQAPCGHGTQGTPRTLFCVVLAAATVGWTATLCAAAAAAGREAALVLLPAVTVAAGLTFGGYWTLMATITSELFGLRFFSSNYAAVQIAPILATCICPTLLVGRMYDATARRQHPSAATDDLPCAGTACFLPAFTILCGIAVLVRMPRRALDDQWFRICAVAIRP